jgi:hypothetical protein
LLFKTWSPRKGISVVNNLISKFISVERKFNLIFEKKSIICKHKREQKNSPRNNINLFAYPKVSICLHFFLDSRKLHFLKSIFCGFRWTSKTPVIPGSYKICTSWLELEICCADLKPFVITLCFLDLFVYMVHARNDLCLYTYLICT